MWPGRLAAAFGITSTRRAAVLAVVVVALALSVAVPLRNYVSQRQEIAQVAAEQRILAEQVAELERRQELLRDPAHIEAQARERLRYVRPGETPYIVQLPPTDVPGVEIVEESPSEPWYTRLWDSITGEDGS